MNDLVKQLTGEPSDVLALDLDLEAKTKSERAALASAKERLAAAKEELRETRALLEKKRDYLKDAERMKRLGAESDTEPAAKAVKQLEALEAEKEQAAKEGRQAVEDARRALRTRTEALRDELCEELDSVAQDAIKRITKALNAAQRASIELCVLQEIRRETELPFDLPPHTNWLLPAVATGDPSVLQMYQIQLKKAGYGDLLQHGSALSRMDVVAFFESVARQAEKAKLDLEEPPASAANDANANGTSPVATAELQPVA